MINLDSIIDNQQNKEITIKLKNKEIVLLYKEPTAKEEIKNELKMEILSKSKNDSIDSIVEKNVDDSVNKFLDRFIGWKNVFIEDVLSEETVTNLINNGFLKEEQKNKEAEFSKKSFDKFILNNNLNITIFNEVSNIYKKKH